MKKLFLSVILSIMLASGMAFADSNDHFGVGFTKAESEAVTFGSKDGWVGFDTYNKGFAKSKGLFSGTFAHSEFDAKGWSTGFNVTEGNIGGSFGIAGIHSEAYGIAGSIGRGSKEAGGFVFGNVYQASQSLTYNDNFIGGGFQKSGAGYIGFDSENAWCRNLAIDSVEGDAFGIGFTKEFSYVGDNKVAALTMVGNTSYGRTDGLAFAYGTGRTGHTQVINGNGGYAGTSGNASYGYIAAGQNQAQGGGFALTTGYAVYNATSTSMNVHAESSAMSFAYTGSGNDGGKRLD